MFLTTPPRLWVVASTRRMLVALFAYVLCAAGACEQDDRGELSSTNCASRLEEIRSCLRASAVRLPPARVLPTEPASLPVKLYVDRSGSMTGYLDLGFGPEFGIGPARSSMRELLSKVTSVPEMRITVYGFGEKVVPIKTSTNQDILAILVRRDFYTDPDTRIEDVLDAIESDTTRSHAHVVITDGRRASGATSLAQYKRLGEVARTWASDTAAGKAPGLFAIAALDAPFRQKPGDRTGCWAAQSATVRHCPLYAFVFAPRIGAGPLLAALREIPSKVFVSPTFSDTAITLAAERVASPGSSTLLTYAASPTEPLRLLYHAQHAQGIDSTTITVSVNASGSSARYSIDDSLLVSLFAAPLAPRPAVWSPVPNSTGAWVKPLSISRDSTSQSLRLQVALRARAQLQPTVYRVEFVSTGRPSWLDHFDASDPADGSRTYGLGSLFEYLGASRTRLAGFYVSVY